MGLGWVSIFGLCSLGARGRVVVLWAVWARLVGLGFCMRQSSNILSIIYLTIKLQLVDYNLNIIKHKKFKLNYILNEC